MKRLYCIFVLLAISSYHSFCQQYPFIRFTPRDGLVSANVMKAFQDSKGKLYFLTVNGFSIYDGSRFINYTTDDGLPFSIVNDIIEITPDSLLIACNTNKLSALVRGKIKPVEIRGFIPEINKFYKAGNSSIYAVTDQGLFQFKDKLFLPIPVLDENNKPIRDLDQLLEIGNYFLIRRYDAFNRYTDLFLINKNTGKTSSYILKINATGFLTLSEEQILLIVANNKIRCFDLEALGNGMVKEVPLPLKFRHLKDARLMNVVKDKSDNIWIMMPSSINRLDTGNHQQIIESSNRIDLNNLEFLYCDRENNIWLTNKGIGIIRLANNNLEILNSTLEKSNFAGSEICTTPDTDSVWILNKHENVLYCYTPNAIQKWHIGPAISVTNILKEKESLIICSVNCIYKASNIQSGQPLRLKKIFHNNDATNNARVITDKNGNIFIPGKTITTISFAGDTSIIDLPGFSDQMCFDNQGCLWVITRANNLLCYAVIKQKKGVRLILETDFSNKHLVSQPRCITIDKKDKIWIGTRYDGIYCFERKGTTLTEQLHFTTADGLTDNFIYDMTFDKTNNLWTSTFSGLDKVYFAKGRYRIANITSINNLYMHIRKVQVDKYNNAWFLAMQNLMRVSSLGPYSTQYIPQLQISRILIENKSIGVPPDGLILPKNTSTLTFDLAVPSSLYEKRILYSYKLEGSDETGWSSPSKQSTFNFVNLKPGKHKLNVRAVFPSSELKSQDLTYQFSILPQWWQTGWFKLAMSFLIVASITILIRLYYERKIHIHKALMEKHKAVEQERTRISMEIHDDLGAGLTSIRYLAAGLTGDSPTTKQEKLSRIITSANELIENMNDIVWTMKSDNNSVTETLSYIRKHAAEQLEYAGINYEFQFPETIAYELTKEQKRNLLLISKETTHNIIKHAQATMVHFNAATDNDFFCLSISDNGKGFTESKDRNPGNGMRNLKARANEMGGNLEVITKKGTLIRLSFKMTNSLNG